MEQKPPPVFPKKIHVIPMASIMELKKTVGFSKNVA
jgi:hypothetical protein